MGGVGSRKGQVRPRVIAELTTAVRSRTRRMRTARRQQLAGAGDRVEGGEEDAALLPTGMPREPSEVHAARQAGRAGERRGSDQQTAVPALSVAGRVQAMPAFGSVWGRIGNWLVLPAFAGRQINDVFGKLVLVAGAFGVVGCHLMLTRSTGYDLVSWIKLMQHTRSLNDPCVCFRLIPEVWDQTALATGRVISTLKRCFFCGITR